MSMKLKPISLSEHQELLYEILYMFDDFCREHGLRYFLVGGSLLGAVRHNAIIPWDHGKSDRGEDPRKGDRQ